MPPEERDQPSLLIARTTIAERVAREFAGELAHPCRRDPATGATLYYLGWKAQGHTVRRWDGTAWSDPLAVPAATVRKSVAAALPGPAPEEKP